MKKKSQMEIMGLAIIVILLVLAMLFIVKVVFLDKPIEVKKAITSELLASNTLNAMVKTNTHCDYTITQLLKDCAEYSHQRGSINCQGKPSCTYAEQTIEIILNESISKLRKKYNFTAQIQGENPLIEIGTSSCTKEKQAADPHPIRTPAGILMIKLYICD